MLDCDRIATTLREFIEAPTDRRRFDAFFALCFHLARGYLASLGRRGFRLPVDEYASTSGLNDCTLDCLATLFVSAPGRPFHLAIDYLERHLDAQTPPDQVAAHLQALVAGHVRQELHRLKGAIDPQAAHIKRSVRRAMRAGDYEEFSHDGTRAWAWRGARNGRRAGMPPVDDARLQRAIVEAIRREIHMPDRCRRVFAQLDVEDHCQNFIVAYRFLAAMARALGDHDGSGPCPLPSPREDFVRTRLQSLVTRAVEETLAGELERLAAKRGLAPSERSAYGTALADLMMDFAEDGDHDLLPQYLKDRLSAAEADRYLSRHKYMWETVANTCKDRLRELLRIEGLEP